MSKLLAETASRRTEQVNANPDLLEGLDLDLDGSLRSVLQLILSEQRWRRYDPLNLEELLSSASAGFDRCLANRREHQDLVAAAFAQVDEYELFQTQLEVARSLEEARWIEELRLKESETQEQVAETFAAAPSDHLAAGFRAAAEGASQVNRDGAAKETERRQLVQRRWETLASHQATLRRRHQVPGHPLNYKDRARRVKEFLLDDFGEAAAQAIAASICLRWGYNLRRAFNETAQQPLDEMVDWTRGAIRMFDEETNGYSESEHVVPLSHTQQGPASLSFSEFCASVGGTSRPYDFSFRRAPSRWAAASLRAVGLSFSIDKLEGIQHPEMLRMRTQIFTPYPGRRYPPRPGTAGEYSSPEWQVRREVSLQNVGLRGATPVEFGGARSVRHVCALEARNDEELEEGIWSIHVAGIQHAHMGNQPNFSIDIRGRVKEIYMHLLIASSSRRPMPGDDTSP